MKLKFWIAVALVLTGLIGTGGYLSLDKKGSGQFTLGQNPDLPTLTFYTTGLATTPQLAFWHAVNQGSILERCNIRVCLWKNLDDLRGILLAGKGDLWLGHTDGFVQAARRGAPVQLMITSGWRKFYLVSRDPGKIRFADFRGNTLAVAPPGSPAMPVLEKMMGKEDKQISFVSHEPRQLAMKLAKGMVDAAVLPEPLVSVILGKVNDLVPGENLESAYGRFCGGEPRMPIAGLAVNAGTAEKYPGLIRFIEGEILDHSRQIQDHPREAVRTLPAQFRSFVREEAVVRSLDRDLVFAARSLDVKAEIMDYVFLIQSGLKGPETGLAESIFWR